MTMMTLAEAARLIDGAQQVGDGDVAFERVTTDSHQAAAGDLFVGLRGERFDGSDFAADVARQGAEAAVLSRDPQQPGLSCLVVADTRLALAQLAAGWRRRFSLPLVAVTGSNGKTTVKEMIAAIFTAAVGASRCLATRGNLNNDIGVPLTLLRLTSAQQYAVVELGMNHPGETVLLASTAAPTVAVVNNAQREHQEFMTSVEAVALEHASAIHALGEDGVAVFPADEPYSGIWRVAADTRRTLEFALLDAPQAGTSCARQAAVRGCLMPDGALQVDTPAGQFALTLAAPGRHNARNALAACAAALAAGVTLDAIAAGLALFRPVSGRLQRFEAALAGIAGATVIDDTYNANPDSVRAAIDVLAECARPRVLVLGEMGEVGDQGAAFHREVGAYARERGIDALFALGDATRVSWQAFGDDAGASCEPAHAARGGAFATPEALVAALVAAYGGEATVLVKGSRYMKMERVVDALTLRAQAPAH